MVKLPDAVPWHHDLGNVITIRLNALECDWARRWGAYREVLCRRYGVTNYFFDNVKGKDSLDYNIQGALGEIAFAKRFGVYPDLSVDMRKGGSDFRYKGHSIDVKTVDPHTRTGNYLEKPALLSPKRKSEDERKCDVYVLAQGFIKKESEFGPWSDQETTIVVLHRWAWSWEFLHEKNLTQKLKRGDFEIDLPVLSYCLYYDELREFPIDL